MGQYFKIINPAKKQFLDAIRFGESVKSHGVFYGYHAVAVAFLVCNIDQVRDGWGKPVYDFGDLAGSWCGDSIFVASDEQGRANEFSLKTSTEQNPDRNLYWMAKEEFEDLSYKAIAMLCNSREDIAETMVRRAATGVTPDRELVDLGNVVFYVGCEPLERALAKEFGAEWAHRYKKAWVEHPA